MTRRGILLVSVLVLLAIVPSSCGKKGRPKPPEEMAPAPVKYLTAVGRVKGVELNWQVPLVDAEGEDLVDLAGFRVKRSVYEEGKAPDFDDLDDILLPPRAEDGETPATAPAVSYSYLDETVQAGVTYEYIVVPFNQDEVEGEYEQRIRVRFSGESSFVENTFVGKSSW